MSTELTAAAHNPAQIAALFMAGANPFLDAVKTEGVSDGVFARHNGKTGEYIVTDGSLNIDDICYVEFLDARQTWLGFDPENKPVRGPEVAMMAGQPLPNPPDLPDVRWNKQIVVPIVTMEGRRMIYTAKADRGTRPMWRLLKAWAEQIAKNRDERGIPLLPMVRFGTRSAEIQIDVTDEKTGMKRKQKTTIFSEEFEITGFASKAEIEDVVAGPVEMKTVDAADDDIQDVEVEVIEPEKPAAPTQTPAQLGMRRPKLGLRQ